MNSAHWIHRWRSALAASLTIAMLVAPATLPAAAPDGTTLQQSRSRAIDFLRTTQADDGSWTTPTVPGITALATVALLRNGATPDDPTVAKGLAFLEGLSQDDGGIYYRESRHRNYETAIAVMALPGRECRRSLRRPDPQGDRFSEGAAVGRDRRHRSE